MGQLLVPRSAAIVERLDAVADSIDGGETCHWIEDSGGRGEACRAYHGSGRDRSEPPMGDFVHNPTNDSRLTPP